MSPRVKTVARRLVPQSLYRRYRRRKVASLIARYPVREVVHSYGGHSLRVHLADPLAEGWYDHDWEEPALFALLRERGVLIPGASVLDLGAHQAVVALMLARMVGEQGSVLAIEAEPHNARVAQINRDLNEARNLTVMHAAGAASEGRITFAEGLNGQVQESGGGGVVEVPAVTIDALAERHGVPDLVFVDVEGYEGHVLEGATAVLANAASSFMVEVHEELAHFGGSVEGILERFEGFELYAGADEFAPFTTLEGPPPPGRFFLVAIAAGARREL